MPTAHGVRRVRVVVVAEPVGGVRLPSAETTAERIQSEAGVRTDRAPDGPGWHIEVCCVLAEGHRALDTARNVHNQVRAAVISHLAAHGAPEAATVTVTVARIVARHHTA
ncbi:hypothetical protein [Streptomyces sp. NTH33]|uniref:hypothetical protein n=1 Tax=Streptomyces sp. NTH33 TaxID=1735453 RepID=UPI0015E88D1A|nr:hypothetical protein [Streptomyces sp. NTH33]